MKLDSLGESKFLKAQVQNKSVSMFCQIALPRFCHKVQKRQYMWPYDNNLLFTVPCNLLEKHHP